jgi:hypothetical protein
MIVGAVVFTHSDDGVNDGVSKFRVGQSVCEEIKCYELVHGFRRLIYTTWPAVVDGEHFSVCPTQVRVECLDVDVQQSENAACRTLPISAASLSEVFRRLCEQALCDSEAGSELRFIFVDDDRDLLREIGNAISMVSLLK